jgi:hypothetical protein
MGNGDVLEILVHKNLRLSEFIVSDILRSSQLPIVFRLLVHIRIKNLSDTAEKIRSWERFHSLISQ